jgi:hypothetical protein
MGLCRRPTSCALVSAVLSTACSTEVAPVDAGIESVIASIRAIDDHAHPMRPVLEGASTDTDFDALPLDGIPPFPIPWRLTPDNLEWAEVARDLYGVAARDTAAAAITAARQAALSGQGMHFATWALDAIGTDVMLANRISMGEGLAAPRFRWVAFADPLLLPLDTQAEGERSPDARSLFPKEEALLRRYVRELGLPGLPQSLDAYVREVVLPTLRREHDAGAVAIKFEAAYLRPLDFADPDPTAAARLYAQFVGGGAPSVPEYRVLQDFLFREITREAGRLGMAVQIHAFDGFGGYYETSGSQPRLLEPVFDDPTLRETRFVIVHGGWPEVGQTESMISKPNVYADISMMDLVLEPSRLALVLRQWLARWPEKVMFGSDAFEGGPDQSWAEVAALSTRSARRALGLALTGMMRDGEIDRDRADTLARMVLRENAAAVYGIDVH